MRRLIQAAGIGRTYQKGSAQIFSLQDIHLEIAEGEFLAIMGPSGSGKSTLLHILGCLDRPSCGAYHLDGIDLSQVDDTRLSHIRNQKIGFVFQSFNLLPQHTVLHNIETPLLYAPSTFRKHRTQPLSLGKELRSGIRERHVIAREIAGHVGLGHRLAHRSSELSGGEMQRVAIARALVTQPPLILADEPTGNLDSRTGREVMAILQSLHTQGKTIIIVTHERTIAEYAERIIFLKDGRIEREEQLRSRQSATTIIEPTPVRINDISPESDKVSRARLFSFSVLPVVIGVIAIAVHGLLLHKLRSFLSVLGIVFGIGAIITMLAAGAGARQEILEQIALLGTQNILVKAVMPSEEMPNTQTDRLSQGLIADDMARIAQVSPYISSLAARREFSLPIQYRQQILQARIAGITPEYQHTGHLALHQGRFLSWVDEQEMQRVCVLGAEIRQQLFAFHDPLGEMVKIRNEWFQVIGTLDNKAAQRKSASVIKIHDANNEVYIPLSASSVFVSTPPADAIQEIAIVVDQADHVDDVASMIKSVLKRVHHGAEDYEVIVPRELLKQRQQAQRVLNGVMGSIAGISLLVGGIGIMNIMLATITERTREIGIRRAIGASRRMILWQFLCETLLLTIIGGILGILLGIGGAYAISVFAQWRTIISLRTILLSFGISACIGIIFGLYPASQGAKMNPIAALRYE